ncbi:MAG TPA: M64 family metallopeptidase [Steroidobacteraceae bacterium]|nr:M64 family metallopeptidase [Steroidobacteraceae bacterium]
MRTVFSRPLLVLLAVLALPAVAAEPGTLRVDYFHTGGRGTEVFAIDRVVVEPLPWPGHLSRTTDDGRSGSYRFEVRSTEGRLLYARGFSPVYGEWATTAEAAERYRTFHESLRFPMPAGPVHVTVLRREPDQSFKPAWQADVDPADMFVERAHSPPQHLLAIEQHGAPPDKVDVLLIGDGYTAAECHSKFVPDARRMAAALFRHEPFASRRSDFNIWGLCPPSAQSGISRPSTGVHHRTPVGASYDAFGSERYILTLDNRALQDVAEWAPHEMIAILANNHTYGGGGVYGAYSTVAVDSVWADYLFVHEFGHHFAGLADEYYTSPVAYEPASRVVEPWEPNVTALLDREHLKWRHLMQASTAVPTPWPKDAFEARERDFQARRKQIRAENRPEAEMDALFREEQAYTTALFRSAAHPETVGAFQGANYDARAYYRPQQDCVMFTRDEVPFCRVCAEALERVIDLYAGPRRAGP